MLTKIILEGEMGDKFGREWELSVSSPREALALIDANLGNRVVFRWIRDNLKKFDRYHVVVERNDGSKEYFGKNEYEAITGEFSKITFVPLIAGSGGDGGVIQTIVGVILLVIAYFFPVTAPYLVPAGMALLAGGIAQMLSPRPKPPDNLSSEQERKASYYFNGPVNTIEQGVPIQLIYGRVIVGSHVISAALDVDQIIK